MTTESRRLVVVTGASGGIGKALCASLAYDGYDVLAQFRSRQTDAEEVRRSVEARGRRCILLATDLENRSGPEEVCRTVEQHLADHEDTVLHGLVNNAALLLGPSFGTATAYDFDRYMAVNVRAALLLSQQLSRLMQCGGSIVNISSAGTAFSSPGDIVYAMSKSALEALTFHSAEALAPRMIRINSVVPGFTDNGHSLFADPAALKHMSGYAVLGGVCDPTIVADAVAFLLSDRSARTTGSILDVSGGSRLGHRRGSSLSLRAMT